MVTYKSFTLQLYTLIIAFSSGLAMAAEGTTSSSSITIWPLIVFIALLIVFRKHFISEATPELSNDDHHENPTAEAVTAKADPAETIVATKAEPKAEPKAKPKAKPKTKPKVKASSNTIDLNDDSNQCQAGTSKGTRCKRTTTLEKASIKIDNITYHLTVCSQHNNEKLKPFSGLIKK